MNSWYKILIKKCSVVSLKKLRKRTFMKRSLQVTWSWSASFQKMNFIIQSSKVYEIIENYRIDISKPEFPKRWKFKV